MASEEVYQQLFEAVENGDVNGIKVLLEPPLNVDTRVCYILNPASRCLLPQQLLQHSKAAAVACRRRICSS